MSTQYDDIIALPHPTSVTHPRMSRHNRAAQFAPFAALTGYDAAIQEAGRSTDRELDLDEDRLSVLDRQLRYIEAHLSEHLTVTITYFVPDQAKSGGAYLHLTDTISAFDRNKQRIITDNGTIIPIMHITDLEFSPLANIDPNDAFSL